MTVRNARRCFRTGLKGMRWVSCTNMDCSAAAQFAVTNKRRCSSVQTLHKSTICQTKLPRPLIATLIVTTANPRLTTAISTAQDERDDLPFLTANNIKGNICPDVAMHNSFLSHKLKTLGGGGGGKEKGHFFSNRKKAPHPFHLQHSACPAYLV
jgi:hypothetical protein